jgi:hypothetical protein
MELRIGPHLGGKIEAARARGLGEAKSQVDAATSIAWPDAHRRGARGPVGSNLKWSHRPQQRSAEPPLGLGAIATASGASPTKGSAHLVARDVECATSGEGLGSDREGLGLEGVELLL